MRYRRKRSRTSSTLGFSATPLIDLIFTLSIFYMLISRFSTDEQTPMDLPSPRQSQAVVPKMPDRAVINCRPVDGGDLAGHGVVYSVGPNRPEPLAVISDRLAAWKRETPELKVVIRADRRIPYSQVRAVMRMLAENAVPVLNVAALAGEGE